MLGFTNPRVAKFALVALLNTKLLPDLITTLPPGWVGFKRTSLAALSCKSAFVPRALILNAALDSIFQCLTANYYLENKTQYSWICWG